MLNIYKNLFIGNESDCFYGDRSGWVVVHACKHPCHQKALRYRGNLNESHPNYLVFEKGSHLFLNMVDMIQPLLHRFSKPIISSALNFIDKNIKSNNVLIHCNLGKSRSPALALLFLAKRKNVISNISYKQAKDEFIKLFPQYQPGQGIEIYLIKYWGLLK